MRTPSMGDFSSMRPHWLVSLALSFKVWMSCSGMSQLFRPLIACRMRVPTRLSMSSSGTAQVFKVFMARLMAFTSP